MRTEEMFTMVKNAVKQRKEVMTKPLDEDGCYLITYPTGNVTVMSWEGFHVNLKKIDLGLYQQCDFKWISTTDPEYAPLMKRWDNRCSACGAMDWTLVEREGTGWMETSCCGYL